MSISHYYDDLISRAVETAPLMARKPPDDRYSHIELIPAYPKVELPEEKQMRLQREARLAFFRAAPDDTEVILNADWQTEDGHAVVEDVSELAKLYFALRLQTGVACSPETISRITRHESQHADAARQQGADQLLFGLGLIRTQQYSYDKIGRLGVHVAYQASINFKTTKLRQALIHAHPGDRKGLSADILHIREMGYSGIEQLGRLAIARNREGGHDYKMPVPLTHVDTTQSFELV